MARGRQREAWNHTANLLAKLHNVNQIDEDGLLRALDFHPHYNEEEIAAIREAAKPEREKGSVAALATLIVGHAPATDN
jgi:hypothetical protein